jgi:hypothetical protein
MEDNDYFKFFYCKQSISKELCQDIIEKFNNEPRKYTGLTQGGVNKDIKDTTDFVITKTKEDWNKIFIFLNKELSRSLKEYANLFHCDDFKNIDQQTTNTYNLLSDKLYIYNFMVQKYVQKSGRYVYHNDFAIDYPKKQMRILTYIWYLNDVEEGGETVFFGKYRFKPETGKLLIFPASWLYPHCGKMPLSSDKYIITGWVYVDAN